MFRRRPIVCTWSVWDLTTYQDGPSRSRRDPLACMCFEAQTKQLERSTWSEKTRRSPASVPRRPGEPQGAVIFNCGIG